MRRRSTVTLAAAIPAALAVSLLTAPAAFAVDTDIVINEVQSDSAVGAADFFELTNVGSAPVDISGWIARDNKDDEEHIVFPANTVIEPGSFHAFETETLAGFGLGKDDTVRIYDLAGTVIAQHSWTEHIVSEGRLPDGTGEFGPTEPTPGAANLERVVVPDYDVESPVVLNEVQSDDPGDVKDWIELYNTGAEPVDISGWVVRDDVDLSERRIPTGTTLGAGEFFQFTVDVDTDDGFGLGKADMVRVYIADGLGLVDRYNWDEHAFTEGRIPDGAGDFVDTEATPGAANVARFAASTIVINEIESNGDARGDWVELANTDTVNTVDLSGWTIVDADPEHEPIVLAAGTTIESGGYRVVFTESPEVDHFGLGGEDSVTVRDASGAVVDRFGWTEHADFTYARCADMTGPFEQSGSSTFEMANDCTTIEDPVVEAEAWPFNDSVTEAVAPGTWGEDMSGLDYDAEGTLWAINNDNSEIFELSEGVDGQFTIVESWVPHYADGSGQPDGEGLTVAGDGAIFLATERDNRFGGVSRPSILRVELGADGASTTTHEWNITSAVGALGANLGPEAIEWISDADAVRLGVLETGAAGSGQAAPVAPRAYDPASYGEHFGGIFTFAVEQTGMIYVAVLEASGEVTILQQASPGDALAVVMGLDWHAGGNALWALCDEACDNRSAELAFVDGELAVQRAVHAPATMDVGFTNEGLAIAWCEANPAATPTVAWIADTPHDGVSLRVAAGDECTAAIPTATPTDTPVPTDTPTPTDTPVPTDPAAGNGQGSGSAGGQGSLPQTGGEAPMGLIAGALLLLLLGAGLVLGRRRTSQVE